MPVKKLSIDAEGGELADGSEGELIEKRREA